MTVGALQDIVFSASDAAVKTIKSLTWNGSANIATQSRHLNDAYTEFVGADADSISFTLVLSKYLSDDPQEDIRMLWEYERAGTPLLLVLGTKSYGKYRWLLKSHKVTVQDYDKRGDVVTAQVTVNLIEYVRE